MKKLLLLLLFLVAFTPLAAATLADDTVAYYKFDENTGTTAGDSTPNGNDGTITGATWTTGIINSGLSFDGVNDYVSTTYSPSGDLLVVNFWVNIDSFSGSESLDNQILSNYDTSSTPSGWYIGKGQPTGTSLNNRIEYRGISGSGGNDVNVYSSELQTDTWYMVTVIHEDGELPQIFIDGINDGTTNRDNNRALNVGVNLHLGKQANPSQRYFEGLIDEVAIFDRTLTSDEISFLYASGSPTTAQQYPYVAGAQNFSVTARDSFDNASLTNFSIIMSNSTDTLNLSTTNGTINTGVLQNVSSLFNITVSSNEQGGYFNKEYLNLNISTNLVANLDQFRATTTDNVTSSSLDNFTVYIRNQIPCVGSCPPPIPIHSSSQWDSLYFNESTTNGLLRTNFGIPRDNLNTNPYDTLYDLIFSAENYFPRYYPQTNITSPLAANLVKWTRINAEIVFNNTPINVFSVEFNGTTYTTTNGDVFIPLFNTTAEVTINAPGYAIQTQNLTANPYLTNYTFSLFNQNTFDIEFYNESSNQLLDNVNISIEFISELEAFNATTSNGAYFVDLLTPGDYQIRYQLAGQSNAVRNYYVTLTNQSFNELRLYLIDEDISAFYVPVVVDGGGNACQQNTISLLRYYVEGNNYRVVEMAQTDSQGQTVLRVRPNVIDYKLLFSGSCGVYETPPTRLIDTTNTYSIVASQSVLAGVEAIEGTSTSLNYINATQTFVYTWNSNNNLVREGCLEVTRRFEGVRTTVNRTCSLGTTGSVLVTIPDANLTNKLFSAQGTIDTNTEFSIYSTDTLEVSFLEGLFDMQNLAPFLALLLFMAGVMFFATSAPALILGTLFIIGGLRFFNILPIEWGVLVGLIFLGGVVLYRLRTN